MNDTATALSGVIKGYCRNHGYPVPTAEYAFHPDRQWRFDFAWPDDRVAMEIEGGTRKAGGGRHNRAQGYQDDCEKYSEAALAGWLVLRLTWEQVNAGTVWDYLDRAFSRRKAPPCPSPATKSANS